MTEQQPQPEPTPTEPTPARVVATPEAEPTHHPDIVKAHQADVADKARAEYLAATAPTRQGQADADKRFAAYDRTYLRFIDGTTSTTAAKAKALAKDLGHEGEHIETRPV